MANRFQTTLSLSIFDGSETELVLVLTYSVSRGSPEAGRFGKPEDYDPGSPDVVEIKTVRLFAIDGTAERQVPGWLCRIIEADEGLQNSLLDDWHEAEAIARERAAEDRRDSRAEA